MAEELEHGRVWSVQKGVIVLVAVMLSVGGVALLTIDGRTNWFEGLQLLAIYAILAIAFYFV